MVQEIEENFAILETLKRLFQQFSVAFSVENTVRNRSSSGSGNSVSEAHLGPEMYRGTCYDDG